MFWATGPVGPLCWGAVPNAKYLCHEADAKRFWASQRQRALSSGKSEKRRVFTEIASPGLRWLKLASAASPTARG